MAAYLAGDTLSKAATSLDVFTIGIPLVMTLTGVIAMQYGTYTKSSKYDFRWLVWLARTVALFSVGQLIVDIMELNQAAHLALYKPAALVHSTTYSTLSMAMAIATSILVQAYFAYIVYRLLSNSKIWLIFVGLTLLTELATGMTSAAAIYVVVHSGSPAMPKKAQLALYITWRASTAVIDTACSLVLCTNLWRARRKSAFQRTHHVLSQLLVSTLETFSLTALLAILGLLCILLPLVISEENLPEPLWHATVSMLAINFIGRIYPLSFCTLFSLTLLVSVFDTNGPGVRVVYSLNRRTDLRSGGSESSSDNIRSNSDVPRLLRFDRGADKQVHVKVSVSTTVDEELEPVHTSTTTASKDVKSENASEEV